MLAGAAVVATWNDITPEARADFCAWHLDEHMAERAGIPGFHRSRRYAPTCSTTQPRFCTLYEVAMMRARQRQDDANRLNAPTPWTLRIAQVHEAGRVCLHCRCAAAPVGWNSNATGPPEAPEAGSTPHG